MDSVDALISLAAQNKSEAIYESLFSVLPGTVLFTNCKPPQGELAEPVQFFTYPLGSWKRVLRFFTRSEHQMLQAPYAGMQWSAIVELVTNDGTLEGIQVANGADDWVAFSRGELKHRIERNSAS